MWFTLYVVQNYLNQWQMAAFEAMSDGSMADGSIGIS
jgi:hypothetical protein